MKRVFAFAMALLVMVGCLTGCGSNGNSATSGNQGGASSGTGDLTVNDSFGNADTAEYKWKIAIDNNVGTNQYDAAVKFCEKLAELSDGNIYTEIYAGQQLGAGTEVLEGLGFGMQQVCIQAVCALAPFCEYANIDATPISSPAMSIP